MKTVVNEFSEELKKKLNLFPIEKDKSVVFRLGNRRTIEYSKNERTVRGLTTPSSYFLNFPIKITDHYGIKNVDENGKISYEPTEVLVGYVEKTAEKIEDIKWGYVEFLRENDCAVTLYMNDNKNLSILYALRAAPNNINNPLVKEGLLEMPNSSVPLFYEEKLEEDIENFLLIKEKVVEMEREIVSASDNDLKNFVEQNQNIFGGVTRNSNIKIIKGTILSEVEKNPMKMLELWKSTEKDLNSLISEALIKGFLINEGDKFILDADKTKKGFLQVDTSENDDILEALKEFLKSNEGGKTLKYLTSKINS